MGSSTMRRSGGRAALSARAGGGMRFPPLEAEQARCRAEIAALKSLLRAGHQDVGGLMLALADWRAELAELEAAG